MLRRLCGPGGAAFVAALLFFGAPEAQAYPWMIQHGYTSCAQCHLDPSGGGILTDYGRAQGEILLRTQYGEGEAQEPGKIKEFLFGAVPLPEPLELQVDVRWMLIPRPGDIRLLLMQADLRASLDFKSVVAYVSGGVVSEGAQAARVTRGETWNAVARNYWLGARPTPNLLVRAGRMEVPFGIRTDEHILYTRSATRTDQNTDQPTGLSAAFGQKKWRAEAMGIVGNFQVAPDVFRERGYAATGNWYATRKLELGVSSMFTRAESDVDTLLPRSRFLNGLTARWSPVERMAVLAEADLTAETTGPLDSPTYGAVGVVGLDYEFVTGVHGRAIVEACDTAFGDGAAASTNFWAAGQWFFAPRVNLRIDAMTGPYNCAPGTGHQFSALGQLHFFL